MAAVAARFRLRALAAIAVVAVLLPVAPAYAARSPSAVIAQEPSCAAIKFFGAHGVNEDPPTKPDPKYLGMGKAPLDTWNWLVGGDGHPGKVSPSGGMSAEAVNIPETDFEGLVNKLRIPLKVNEGVDELGRQLKNSMDRCPNQKYILVGYSMGAWVIHRYFDKLKPTPDFLARILAMVVYGDPQRWDDRGNRIGLARYLPFGIKAYVPPGLENRFQSWCVSYDIKGKDGKIQRTAYDPICALNKSTGLLDQDLANCQRYPGEDPPNPLCPHTWYPELGATERAASWLAGRIPA